MGKKKNAVRIKQIGPKGGMPNPNSLLPFNPMEEAFKIQPDEMVHLPPKPDRSYQVFWPMHETFRMNITKFQTIYPSYLDSTKSIKMGRRIGIAKAVPKPTVGDISQVLQSLQVRHVIQPFKGYSRDITMTWDNPGRVRVDMSSSLFDNKYALLLLLAERISTLPDRQTRLKMEAEEAATAAAKVAAEREAATAANRNAAISAAASSSANNKKKGKKGKQK